MPEAVAVSARSRVLLDVVEEHLDEAAYGLWGFARALRSPSRTLADLQRYPEENLIAHVAALRVGGAAVREQLLIPALNEATEEEPERLSAAAWVLMESSELEPIETLLKQPEPWMCGALADAARHVRESAFDRWLDSKLAAMPAALDTCALLALAHARQRPVPALLGPLQSDDPRVAAAAAEVARHADSSKLLGVTQYLLGHEDSKVREAALVCGLSWGIQSAWALCKAWALDAEQPSALATVLYAALGTRREHAELVALLDNPKCRPSILFALGFSGNPAVAPQLIECLGAEPAIEAKLAAQALGLIFGFAPGADEFSLAPEAPVERTQLPPAEQDPEAQASLPPLEEDDLDADLVPLPEDELPQPNAQAIADYCARAWKEGATPQRVLNARVHGAEQTAQVLASAPLSVRHALALAHGVRSGGSVWLDTRAATASQRANLPRVAAAPWQRFTGF